MNKFFVFYLLVSVMACQQTINHQVSKESLIFEAIEFSKMFGIAKSSNEQFVFTINNQDTNWYHLDKTQKNLKIVVLSSVFSAYLSELNCQKNIIGVDNIHYYNDSILLHQFNQGLIVEIGEDGLIDEESLLRLKPDIVVGSSFNKINTAFMKRLKLQNIEYIICDNFKEQHPLARAEWIKFFGSIMNQTIQSDSIFNVTKLNYQTILKTTNLNKNRKMVMTDAKFGDTWNVPGGNSYTAQLINDAGGLYIFQQKTDKFSYPLSMEVVIKAASLADIWIHTNQYKSLKDMIKVDNRYAFFKPFNSHQVFNNNKRENKFGGNDFWEKGVVRPDIILKDLQSIFSGDSNKNDSLHFYTKLN
ncbi:MAG: ABC transporter substrate-binding protein [Bacteroidota bacterium]|nr:ABC transporter substrate-binding protein [Bacteroidota bacterium]